MLIELSHVFGSAWRNLVIKQDAEGDRSIIRIQDPKEAREFDRLMRCQCHACLLCLSAGSKLPAGSHIPSLEC